MDAKSYYEKNKDKLNSVNNEWHHNNKEYHNIINYCNRNTKEGREKWLKLQNRYNNQNRTLGFQYGPYGARKTLQVRLNSPKLEKYISLIEREDWKSLEKFRKVKMS